MVIQVELFLFGGVLFLQVEEYGGLVRKKLLLVFEGKGEFGVNDVCGGELDSGVWRFWLFCVKLFKEGIGQQECESLWLLQLFGVEGLVVSDGEEGGGELGVGGGVVGVVGVGCWDFVEVFLFKVNLWIKNVLQLVLIIVNGQFFLEYFVLVKVVRVVVFKQCKGSKVGDFGDVINWFIFGEIVYKSVQLQFYKFQFVCKLLFKKDMKEQEKGEGSDSKESLKIKLDELGEEKNGDEDCQ